MEKCAGLDNRKKLNMLFVIGNACRDTTYHVASLPRPGETALALRTTVDLGGKGFNQAIAARRAGQSLRFIAVVGSDDIADDISTALAIEAIDAKDLLVRDGVSDSSAVFVDALGENVIVSNTTCAEALHIRDILGNVNFKGGNVLLLQGNLSRETTQAAVVAAKVAGATIVMNAAPFRDWLTELAGHIDILIVNALELYLWARSDLSLPLQAVIEKAGVSTVITTLGSKGCLVRLADGALHSIAAPLTNVIDTTGAGDVFTGTYVQEWMSSRNHVRAATLAVHAASDKVCRHGSSAAFPPTETIEHLRRKIIADQQLTQPT